MLFLLAVPCRSQQAVKTYSVPFHESANGLILLDAQINGKSAVLLLDTGAARTIVSLASAPLLQWRSNEALHGKAVQVKVDLRLAVYIETEPGEGCEYDTVLYFGPSYVGAGGISGGKHIEVKIRKDGSADTAEIPATVFRVKVGSRISYHVEYLIGGQCKTRPKYQIWPLLEKIGGR